MSLTSFHYSAQDVRVDDGHILRARLQNGNGDYVDAEIDLNQHIGNTSGNFTWDGVDFAGSAENISFNIEGEGSVPILRADLDDGQGNRVPRDINLGERISNVDGQLVYN